MTATDLLENLRASRQWFLKHLVGATDEQWTWKPYAECKSIAETVAHLVSDDKAALDSLQTGKEPNYEACQVSETDKDRLLALLAASHAALLSALESKLAGLPADASVCAWGWTVPAVRAIGLLASEDYYHAGQVAYIRCATDPAWDYYAALYADFQP